VGLRRLAREIALRILFQYEVSENLTPQETFDLFCRSFSPDGDGIEDPDVLGCKKGGFKKALPFIHDLFFGVTSHQEELDRMLAEASDNWKLGRMSRVDRNVMRIALYEMLFKDDIPFKVSLNEAVDLGKEFGTEDSGSFINGVLDRIHLQLTQKNRKETS
jgi:N utilization substance protein B